MPVCASVRTFVCLRASVKGTKRGEKKRVRMLVQERLFIYVAIYLNKVHFLNCLLFELFKSYVEQNVFTDMLTADNLTLLGFTRFY